MEILKQLEDRVRAAREQLEALRKLNRGLKTKVKKLEAELAAGADGGDWKAERDDIRTRVAKLSADLEGLL